MDRRRFHMRWLISLIIATTMVVQAIAAPPGLEHAPPTSLSNLHPADQPVLMTPATCSPAALWKFPNNPNIHAITILPDGATALVSVSYNAVNIWALLVNYWPEWSAVIVALLLAWIIYRTWKHEQVVGEPYCQRCGYRLKKLKSARCPECGVELTRRTQTMGQPRPWGTVALTIVLAALIAVYVLYGGNAHRGGDFQQWLNWSSPALYEWADAHGHSWVTREGGTRLSRVVEISMADGAIRRVISDESSRTTYTQFAYSPVENCIAGVRAGEGRIDLIDARTGTVRPLLDFQSVNSIFRLTFDESGRTLFAFGLENWRIDTRTTASQRLVPTPEIAACMGAIVPIAGSSVVWTTRLEVAPSSGEFFVRASQWDLPVNRAGETVELPGIRDAYVATASGRLVGTDANQSLCVNDVRDHSTRIIAGTRGCQWWKLRCSADGGRLIALETLSNRIGIFDLDQATHIGTVQCTALGYGDLAVTPDGRMALVMMQDSVDGLQKIAKFNLDDLVIAKDPSGP